MRCTLHISVLDPTVFSLLDTLCYQGFPLFCNCRLASQLALSNWHVYMLKCHPPFKKIPFSLLPSSSQSTSLLSESSSQWHKLHPFFSFAHLSHNFAPQCHLASTLITLSKLLSPAKNWTLLGLYVHLSNILPDPSIAFDTFQVVTF